MRTAVLLVFLSAVGCGYDIEVTPADPPPPKIGLWVEDGIQPRAVAAACDAWAPVGISCVPAISRETALIVFDDSHEENCAPGADGILWVGQGSRGWVTMRMNCYPGGRPDDQGFIAALTHEIGHALGCLHITAPDAVMWPTAGALRITPDDIAEYHRANP